MGRDRDNTDIIQRQYEHSNIVFIDRIKYSINGKYLNRDIIKKYSTKADKPYYTFFDKKTGKEREVYQYFHYIKQQKGNSIGCTLIANYLTIEFNDVLQDRYDEATPRDLLLQTLESLAEKGFFLNPKNLSFPDLADFLWKSSFKLKKQNYPAISLSEFELTLDFCPEISRFLYRDIKAHHTETGELKNVKGSFYSNKKNKDNDKSIWKLYNKSKHLRDMQQKKQTPREKSDIYRLEFTFDREAIKYLALSKRFLGKPTFWLVVRKMINNKFFKRFNDFASRLKAKTIEKIINIIYEKDIIFAEKYRPTNNLVHDLFYILLKHPFTFDNHRFAAKMIPATGDQEEVSQRPTKDEFEVLKSKKSWKKRRTKAEMALILGSREWRKRGYNLFTNSPFCPEEGNEQDK